MSELLDFAFQGINVFPSVLLIFVMVYWGIVILGVIDLDAMDIDLDVDLDGGVEMGGLASVLSFFNIGHMPLMIFISFFVLPLWMLTMLGTDFFGFSGSISGLIVLIPSFVASLFIAKLITIPIAKFYRRVRQNTEAINNVIGQVCTAKMQITSDRKGQAEIKINGTSILINALTTGSDIIEKGATALILDQNKDQNFYFVAPYNL